MGVSSEAVAEAVAEVVRPGVVLYGGGKFSVEVGRANNVCPACERKSLRVYEPAFRAKMRTTGEFFSDGFLAKCRRRGCGLVIGDVRELGPSEGGWYSGQ